jgi:hypothetical protein
MFLVTNPKDNTLPAGGVQHASGFIDKILPAHRQKVRDLAPNQRVTVTFCPMVSDAGFPVEVFRCPEGRIHDEAFNEAIKAARAGEDIGDLLEACTERQIKQVQSVMDVVAIQKGGVL